MSELPPLPDEAGLVARLRKTNAGLREVINTQAVQIETLSGRVTAVSAQLQVQAEQVSAQAELIAAQAE